MLPPGKYPWSVLATHLSPIINRAKRGNRPVIRHRFKVLADLDPEEIIVGRAGFYGYIVFAFPKRNLYILESSYYGNATYVFDKKWAKLSQLTKAQIIDGDLQKERIIHRKEWESKVKKLFR